MGKAADTADASALHPADIALIAVLCVLLVAQGGYYSFHVGVVACASLVAAVAVRLACGRGPGLHVPCALLVGVGCCSLASALANGASAGMLVEASKWFALAGIAVLVPDARDLSVPARRLTDAVCWLGVISALAGVFMFADVLPADGAMRDGRLQFTFQYANTAAVWFSVAALLCACSQRAALRVLAFVPLLAMLLTRSVGGIACFLLAAAVLCALWSVHGEHGRSLLLLVQTLLAFAAFASCAYLAVLAPVWAGIGVLAAAVLCREGVGGGSRLDALFGRETRPALVAVAALLLVASLAAVALVVMPERLQQAGQTFLKRYIQIYDALALVGTSPVLGTGPDTWRYLYPFVQSAQYRVSVVHCSYLQFACDAGLAGLACFLAFIAVGFKSLVRRRQPAVAVVAGAVAFHALFDFDFEFGFMVVLLAFLLYGAVSWAPRAAVSVESAPRAVPEALQGTLAFVACCVLLFAASATGCVLGHMKDRVHAQGLAGDVAAVRAALSGTALFGNDVELRDALCTAYALSGSADEALAYAAERQPDGANQALLLARCLMRGDEQDAGVDLLLAELEREPYNTALFEEAGELLGARRLSAPQRERYEVAVVRANELTTQGNAALLVKHKKVKAKVQGG